jgi:hypothetical protein
MIYSYQLISLFSKLLHHPSLDVSLQLCTMAYTVFPHAKAKGRKNEGNEKVGFQARKPTLKLYSLKVLAEL